jgi:hypothetical protein
MTTYKARDISTGKKNKGCHHSRGQITQLSRKRIERGKERTGPGTYEVVGIDPRPAAHQIVVSPVLLIRVGIDQGEKEGMYEKEQKPENMS